MSREKRSAPTTVHFRPLVKMALEHYKETEQRTLSTIVSRIVEKDPTVQLLIQKLERQVERN